MSIPTVAEVPRLRDKEDLLNWAKRLNEFLTQNLAIFALPEARLTLTNGRNDNVNLKGGIMCHIQGPTGAFQISGLGGGSPGRLAILQNDTAFVMTVNNNDVNSQVMNRILTFSGNTVASIMTLIWDHLQQHWLAMASR